MPRNSETDDIVCVVLGEVGKTYKLQCGDRTALFPQSQVSFKRRNIKTGAAVAEIPVWLLKKEGWDRAGDSPIDDMPEEL